MPHILMTLQGRYYSLYFDRKGKLRIQEVETSPSSFISSSEGLFEAGSYKGLIFSSIPEVGKLQPSDQI